MVLISLWAVFCNFITRFGRSTFFLLLLVVSDLCFRDLVFLIESLRVPNFKPAPVELCGPDTNQFEDEPRIPRSVQGLDCLVHSQEHVDSS